MTVFRTKYRDSNRFQLSNLNTDYVNTVFEEMNQKYCNMQHAANILVEQKQNYNSILLLVAPT